jgi:hypothetical protein
MRGGWGPGGVESDLSYGSLIGVVVVIAFIHPRCQLSQLY